MRDVTCRSCGRTGTKTRGQPPTGWYFLTVTDPHAPNKRYRYLGMFCSVACLGAHLPEMADVEADIRSRVEATT